MSLGIVPLAGCLALAACQPAATEDDPVEDTTNGAVLNLESLPRPKSPIDRVEILTAVARAASATAAGIDDRDEQRALDGAPFEFRLRFGCRGPAPDLQEAMLGWSLDEESGTLRVRATPTISSDDELVKLIAGEDFEAVEGFWIPRPWILEPACPAAVASGQAEATAAADPAGSEAAEAPPSDESTQEAQIPAPASPQVGLAQFFRGTDPRTGRRGQKPYETLKTLDQSPAIGAQGFNLVVSGRLQALPSKRVIACIARGADAPPDCIVSTRVDRIRLERPDTNEVLAEWGSS